MSQGVKLFGSTYSPFSCRIKIALQMKGVQYEYQEEDLANKSPELLQYNPVHKKIPVLVHNGKAIAESLVILDYIDEAWEGNPILPQDPYERAIARFWAKFIDDKWTPLLFKVFMGAKEERESALEEILESVKFLEKELGSKKFFGGDNIGFVDIVACLLGHWIPILEEVTENKLLSNGNYPNLCRWQADYASCSFIKENVPCKEMLASMMSKRFAAAQ